jgi:hypothetical protein
MEMRREISFGELGVKTVVAHTITYMFMGVLAYNLLDYQEAFSGPILGVLMKPIDSTAIMMGPALQPIRGIVFALAFYPLRIALFGRDHDWLITGWLLTAIGVLGTFGPAPGSIEGMIYTQLPVFEQMIGWLEGVPQAFLLAGVLCYWLRNPEKRWVNVTLYVMFIIVMMLPFLGLLAGSVE